MGAGSRAYAQEPALVLYGFVQTGDGIPPTKVRATIGDVTCGTADVNLTSASTGAYALVVVPADQKAGCGTDAALVSVLLLRGEIGPGVLVAQVPWRAGGLVRYDLSATMTAPLGGFVGMMPDGPGAALLRWNGASGVPVERAVTTITRASGVGALLGREAPDVPLVDSGCACRCAGLPDGGYGRHRLRTPEVGGAAALRLLPSLLEPRCPCCGPRSVLCTRLEAVSARRSTLDGMAVRRMDHVGIVVDDLEAAVAFFVELGLEVEGRQTVEGEWVDRISGMDDVRADIAMLRTPDGHGLELTKYDRPAVITAEPTTRRRTRWVCAT